MYRCGPAQGGVLPGSGASGGGETVIGTERFKSRIMQVNLQATRRAPYDASMGAKTYHMSEGDRLHSTDDLVGWLTRLITRYAGLVFEQADVKRKDILYDAINYMKQHLGERVTLEDTARQVGFSPNYRSVRKKEEQIMSTLNEISEAMQKGKGLTVIDLGVDVPPEKFIEAAIENDCSIICCSALLTTTMPVMGEVVEKAVEAGVRDKVKIMIGGAPVTEAFGRSINADAYTPDATTCAEVAMQLLAS